MATLERTITVQASPEHVFRFVDDPHHLMAVLPGLLDVCNVQRLPNNGRRFKWTYKMAGVHFEGFCETTDYLFGQREVSQTHGGITSTIAWTLRPTSEGTQVNLNVDYKVPPPLIGRLTEEFIIHHNEQQAECLLKNLKGWIEHVEGLKERLSYT